MLVRKKNKYIKNEKYYLYTDGDLTKMKLSKKAFSKLLQSDTVNQQAILNYINSNRLSLKDEADLMKALNFIAK